MSCTKTEPVTTETVTEEQFDDRDNTPSTMAEMIFSILLGTDMADSLANLQIVPQAELVLRLSREPERPHVNWTTDTVDNEHLGKKKSKCCCIYKKKKTWQDSSSSDDSDCETGNCRGHVEKRKEHDSHPTGDGHDGPCEH